MEGLPKQQPLEQHPNEGKANPDPNTDFGDEAFDYNSMPQKRFSAGGFNEWIFGLMRPKSKVSAKTPIKPKVAQSSGPVPTYQEDLPTNLQPISTHHRDERPYYYAPPGFEIQNGLLMQKKTLPERVRDQIKFPVLKSSQSIINGAALVIFAVGAYILYSELPTRPELVVGILLVAISANLIISNR
jgi:hypothetical protein